MARDADIQELLDRFQAPMTDLPVLICRGAVVLRIPSNRETADCLGFNDAIEAAHAFSIVSASAPMSSVVHSAGS